jgi:hypothetical protein
VVNQGGTRRTVVQPVEMPADWEMGQTMPVGRPMVLSAPLARGPGRVPFKAMRRMPAAMAQAAGIKTTMGSVPRQLMQKLMGKHPAETPATTAEREKVRQALEAFLKAFVAVRDGRGGALELEQARVDLLRALGESLPIATAVPLLQAYLRAAAVDLVAAVAAGGADPALYARHAPMLEAALNQARGALGEAGAPAGSFWEASI